MSDIIVEITVPFSVVNEAMSAENKEEYTGHIVIDEWMSTQVITTAEIMTQIEEYARDHGIAVEGAKDKKQ